MTKKRLLLIAALPLIIAMTLGVLAMLPARPGVTKANFDRIEEGMNIQEVELLLGGAGQPFHGFVVKGAAMWMGDDGAIVFVALADKLVIQKTWQPSTESIIDKLWRWLHLPK